MTNAISRFGIVVALVVAVAISASGQGRSVAAPMRASSTPAPSFSGSGHGFAGRPRVTGTRPGAFRGFARPLVGTPLNPNFAPLRGAPGFGFDFEHLAAIQGPSRGRFGRGGRDRGGFFTPLFFGGFPLYYPGDYPYDNEYPNPNDVAVPDNYAGAAQPPIFVIPQPQQNTSAPAEPAPRQALTPQALPAPPPELGQLILVRSDGEVLLAVAFTVRNGQLTYITNEGTRRSFPFSELDKQATQQMNDANGTSVSLPK